MKKEYSLDNFKECFNKAAKAFLSSELIDDNDREAYLEKIKELQVVIPSKESHAVYSSRYIDTITRVLGCTGNKDEVVKEIPATVYTNMKSDSTVINVNPYFNDIYKDVDENGIEALLFKSFTHELTHIFYDFLKNSESYKEFDLILEVDGNNTDNIKEEMFSEFAAFTVSQEIYKTAVNIEKEHWKHFEEKFGMN